MAKINPQKLNVEQFQDQSSWIGKLFSTLNQFMNDVFISYSNGLTVEDNLNQEIRDVKFKNTASNFPLVFQTKFSTYPKGLVSIYLLNNTTGNPSGEIPGITWSFSNNQVKISSIAGLTSNNDYTLRLLVIYN